jgi:hypothetical protein
MKYHVAKPLFVPREVPQSVLNFIAAAKAALQSCYDTQSILMRAQPMSDNMTFAMRRALFDLHNDPSLIVKPSDKNMGLCILDAAWYVAECNRQLSNPATYASVLAAAMSGLISQLQQQVVQLAERWQPLLPGQVYNYIVAQASPGVQPVVPFFYLLP